jgi:hypothetical protein
MSTTMSDTSVSAFIGLLGSATPAEAAEILAILDRGSALWAARRAEAEEPKKETAEPQKLKKEKAAKAVKPVKPVAVLPEAAAGQPEASEYRVPADSIDHSTCVARSLKGGEDKRWKPIIFRESQCGGAIAEGSDICSKCAKREAKYAEEAKPGDWTGRVTEEPLEWVHMLGTAWAASARQGQGPMFRGSADSSAADSGAEEIVAAEEKMPAPPKPVKADKAAEKEATKAKKEAEKEAAKAKKEAEKEAAKAKKEAEKEAAKAKKDAEKAAKPAKVVKAKAAKAVVAEPVVVEGSLKLIDGSLYMVKEGNVYEYDELAETTGDFVGRLTGEDTIDTEAEEVTAAESDTD